MEKLSREELLMKKLVKESGLEKPSVNFAANVMNAIAVKKAVSEYKPLISKRGWILISSVLGVFFVILLQGAADTPLIPYPNFLSTFSFPVVEFEISRTMTWAFAFVALFLLEIPFLKRMIEKQY